MIKKLLLTTIILTSGIISGAQTVPTHISSFRIAGMNEDQGKYVDLDSSGNLYVAGLFGTGCDFDPGSGISTMTPAGNSDIFLAKYSPSGTLLWKYSISGNEEYLFGLDVDAAGNAILIGSFSGSLTAFGMGSNVGTTSNSAYDAFTAKYNSSGQLKFMWSIGGIDTEEFRSVTSDSNGNIYIGGGFYSSNVDVDPGAGQAILGNTTLTGSGINPFILKYDSLGNYVWALNLKNTNRGKITGLAIDASGRLVAGGDCYGTMVVDSAGTTVNALAGLADNIILRFSTAGIFDNGWTFGGPDNDIMTGMAVSGNDIVATGTFETVTDLDPGVGTHTVNTKGDFDVYVVKINENGMFQWGGAIQGPYLDGSGGITTNAAGEVYVTGFFRDTAYFDLQSGGPAMYSHLMREGFMAKYSSGGNLITALIVGGSNFDECQDVVHTGNGEFYITGTFYDNPIYLDPAHPNVGMNNLGIYDAFIAKYSDNLVTVGISSIQKDDINVYPVPAGDYINIELKNIGNYTAGIMDFSGRFVSDDVTGFTRSTRIDTHSLESGVYFISVKNENSEPVYYRFIKQ